ncbi:LOW QUALITY PROTEIN: hypothetical protein Cgig2_032281 [Carnegiea gigantea]|uniref:Uncharacterized protein n=1 Tax=Carnegiea gigantea TaxID=171969 RepID=A0A9Q1JK37_9CARY|nr:LOW QUALITY PROTEIN: hypothetical protein Cgig2_032281 [Carnegiea gigantea]
MVTSSSVTLRGPKYLRQSRLSQVLDQCKLGRRIGPNEVRGKLSGTYRSSTGDLRGSPHNFRGAKCFPGSWGIGVKAAASSWRSLTGRRLHPGKLIAGFFPRCTRRGAYNKENNLVTPFFFSTTLGFNRYPLGGGVPSLKVQRLPIARLALPLLRPPHRLYRLSHEFWDKPQFAILPDEVMKVAGCLLLFGSCCPKGILDWLTLSAMFSQPDSRRTKRKSYFQYFAFDFFLMAVMKHRILLKQYHPRSPVSLGAL